MRAERYWTKEEDTQYLWVLRKAKHTQVSTIFLFIFLLGVLGE